MERCPICACSEISVISQTNYVQCSVCTFQFPNSPPETGVVTNQLPRAPQGRGSSLARRQSRLVNRISNKSKVIDIGCGNGEFLFAFKHLKGGTADLIGIEKDTASITAAQQAGLTILTDIPDSVENATITMWHSAEHINVNDLMHLLTDLSAGDNDIVIAVPNGNSRSWRKYKKSFSFFDSSSHLSQFTPRSLDLMLSMCGWRVDRFFLSPFYGLFNAIQTTLNESRPHNELYQLIKRQGRIPHISLLLRSFISILRRLPTLISLLLAEAKVAHASTILIKAVPMRGSI